MDYEERIKRIKTLKKLLRKHGWIIDICQDIEPGDSEILLSVIEEFNQIYKS